MTTKHYLFLLLLCVLTSTSTTAIAQSFEGRIHLMRVVGTDTSYYQYYVKEPNVRIEELDKKGKIQGYLVMNMLSNKIFAVSPSNKMWLLYDNKIKTEVTGKIEYARTGNYKKIAGILCELWAVTNVKERTNIDYWVAAGNYNFFVPHLQALNRKEKLANYFILLNNVAGCIPLEAYQHSKDESNKALVNQSIRTIKVEPKLLDIKMFKVPSMYRKYDLDVSF
ncbi:MAG: DUF4412 domain-containing protein [Bacteroidia bacterium]|nr:DUF4412 domain-containing protein [Bacteroidia bacterium]